MGLFIKPTVCDFRERLSMCVSASFPFSFEGWLLDLIVFISDHRLSINVEM